MEEGGFRRLRMAFRKPTVSNKAGGDPIQNVGGVSTDPSVDVSVQELALEINHTSLLPNFHPLVFTSNDFSVLDMSTDIYILVRRVLLLKRWELIPSNSICAWNVQGINKVNKQFETASFVHHHNINVFGVLEAKVKRAGLGALYLRIFPNWSITSNLNWHRGDRIVSVWKSEDMYVDILACSSQLIHLYVHPRSGKRFYSTFVYGSNDRKERLHLSISFMT